MNVFLTATFVCLCCFTVVAEETDGPAPECLEACPGLKDLATLMQAAEDGSNRRLAAKLQDELAAAIGKHRRLNEDPTEMLSMLCTDTIVNAVKCLKTNADCAGTVTSLSQSEDMAMLLGVPCMCETCPLIDVMKEITASMQPKEGAAPAEVIAGMMTVMFDTMCKVAPITECMEAENKKQANSCPTQMTESMTKGDGDGSAMTKALQDHSACMCSICPAIDTLKEMITTPADTDEEKKASACNMLSIDGCFEKANAKEAGTCPSGGMMSMMDEGGDGRQLEDMSAMKKECEDQGLLESIEPDMDAGAASVGVRTAPRSMLAAASVAMVWWSS